MYKLSLAVARGAMINLCKSTSHNVIEEIGLLYGDFEKVRGNEPWMSQDRNAVTKTLDALCYSTLYCLGLPKIELPAEYIAAVIATFCKPVNYMVACRWIEGHQAASDLARSETAGQVIHAQQLFALVCMMESNGEMNEAKAAFESKLDYAIKDAMGQNVPAEPSSKSKQKTPA